MTATEIAQRVSGEIVTGKGKEQAQTVYVGDLLSDVMGHAGDECVLVTIQNHMNTLAVCTLVGCQVVVLCHNRSPSGDMFDNAKHEGIALITTAMSQYEAAVALSSLPPSRK